MRDLENLDRPRGQRARHVRLGVGGQEHVDLAVASPGRRSGAVRILAPASLAVGQSTRRLQSAEPERFARPRLEDRDASFAASARAIRSIDADRARWDRARYRLQPAQHGLGAADVIALWMREHDRRERAHAECAELLRDVRLGWPRSTSSAPSGTSSRVESPWPTSRNVTRSPPGGGSDADGQSARRGRRERRRGARQRGGSPRPGQPLERERCERGAEQYADGLARADLRQRQPGDDPGDEAIYAAQPAVKPRERERDRRQHRLEQRADEGEPEERAIAVRRARWPARLDRDRAELQPDDRRRCDPARGRDRERPPGPAARDIPRAPAGGAAAARKIAATAANESWKPARAGTRRPGEQHQRTHGEGVPPIARPGEQPRERGRAAGDPGTHDRRLPADGEHVGGDRADRGDLGRESLDADQPARTEHTDRDERDVLPRDGEQVFSPVALNSSRSSSVSPSSSPSTIPASTRAARPRARASRARRARAACRRRRRSRRACRRPPRAAQDDVDAAPGQPAALVEAGLGTARRRDRYAQGEDGALRRRAPDGSSRSTRSRMVRDSKRGTSAGTRNANGVVRAGPVTTTSAPAGADLAQPARCDRARRPRAAPPPAGECERERQPAAAPPTTARRRPLRSRRKRGRPRRPRGVRECDPDADREDEERRPAALDDAGDHGETSSRNCSTRAGPIPGIASRSSTERNPPCAAR